MSKYLIKKSFFLLIIFIFTMGLYINQAAGMDYIGSLIEDEILDYSIHDENIETDIDIDFSDGNEYIDEDIPDVYEPDYPTNETEPDQIPELYSFETTLEVLNGWVSENDHYYYYIDGVYQTGWIKINESWYYLDLLTGIRQTGWLHIGTKRYYLNADGIMQTGWLQIDNTNYYFDPVSGAMGLGWMLINTHWYFFNEQGTVHTGWLYNGAKWYYLNPFDGIMWKGWLQLGTQRYYLHPTSGAMHIGWLQIDGQWRYFNPSGAMQTGWVWDKSKWYYLSSSGIMQTGWLQLGANRYYLHPTNGNMSTGWTLIGGYSWYFFNENGAMQTGWLRHGTSWYYLSPGGDYTLGVMRVGWLHLQDNSYYLHQNGAMASGTVNINGRTHRFNNASGAWIFPGRGSAEMDNFSAEVLRLVNIERGRAGISHLARMDILDYAAQIRAEECITLFSHTRPDGREWDSIFNDFSIRMYGAGENIAMGLSSPAAVVNGWMNSPGHRANILNANHTHLGVGVVRRQNGTLNWVQLFIRQ